MKITNRRLAHVSYLLVALLLVPGLTPGAGALTTEEVEEISHETLCPTLSPTDPMWIVEDCDFFVTAIWEPAYLARAWFCNGMEMQEPCDLIPNPWKIEEYDPPEVLDRAPTVNEDPDPDRMCESDAIVDLRPTHDLLALAAELVYPKTCMALTHPVADCYAASLATLIPVGLGQLREICDTIGPVSGPRVCAPAAIVYSRCEHVVTGLGGAAAWVDPNKQGCTTSGHTCTYIPTLHAQASSHMVGTVEMRAKMHLTTYPQNTVVSSSHRTFTCSFEAPLETSCGGSVESKSVDVGNFQWYWYDVSYNLVWFDAQGHEHMLAAGHSGGFVL